MLMKIAIGVLISAVIVLGISVPMVTNPAWYQFPVIPGLEEKARIIFFHVPTAWLSVVAYLTSMVYAISYLRKRDPLSDQKSVAAAGLGLMFTILATITGAVWAKFNWGSYWNWDPRETSIFVLLLIYGAYFSLRSAVEVEEKRATLSSVYSIIAAVTVPFFVFIMPRIMTGLHPGAKGDPGGAGPVVEFKMAPGMRIVFFTSLFAFTLLFVWMFRLRVRLARIELHQHQEG